MVRKLARRWWSNYRWLYKVTRADVPCGAVLLPWTRAYRELATVRRDAKAGML